jgi:hypothetical protein
VEHTFDRRRLRIPFPPQTERVARMLYSVNQARASLTAAASHSSSLPELHRYERRLNDATKPVEAAVRTRTPRLAAGGGWGAVVRASGGAPAGA